MDVTDVGLPQKKIYIGVEEFSSVSISNLKFNFWVHKVFQVTSDNLADRDPHSSGCLQAMLGYQRKPPVGLLSTVAPTPSRR